MPSTVMNVTGAAPSGLTVYGSVLWFSIYTMFHKKAPFCFFITQSNGDQFTWNFYHL